MLGILTLLAACRVEPSDGHPRESRHQVVQDDLVSGDSAADSAPGPTEAAVPFAETCDDRVLPIHVPYSSTAAIRTWIDFDFDQLGFLDTPWGSDVLGYTRTGGRHRVATAVGVEVLGVRSLVTGDLVVSVPQTGVLKRVTYDTGATSTIVGGLIAPRALEVGTDGLVYASEPIEYGVVRSIDPYTGESDVIAALPFPGGMALSPDEQRLYVVTTPRPGGPSTVVAIERDEDGDWDPAPQPIFTTPTSIDALVTDLCGNLYVAETWRGRVYRVRPDDGGIEPLATLEPGFGLTAMRFGNGIGDFARDQLFVSNGVQLYVLEVGVDGRHVLGL